MKLKGLISLKGKIKILTGLHIGGNTDTIEIGGLDNPIITNPLNSEPYIPGSSLKGKMRSLLELKLEKFSKSEKNYGGPCGCGEESCPVCNIFGCGNSKNLKSPTKLIVRDAFLSNESKKLFKSDLSKVLEVKHEVSINRIKAKSNPRPIERVVPGVLFDYEFVFQIMEDKDIDLFKNEFITSMVLLEHSYLGGGGTRGNGQVKFLKDEIKIDYLLDDSNLNEKINIDEIKNKFN